MKNKFLFLLIIGTLMTGQSCKESELDLKNQGAYGSDNYFATAPQFNEAVIATYATLLQNGLFAREWYFIFDTMGNDADAAPALLGDLQQLTLFSHDPEHVQIKALWQTLYRIIFRANLVLDKATQWAPITADDKALRKQYLAEAHFLKGFSEFLLVNCWGRVPIRPDFASSSTNFNIPRAATIADAWSAAEQDLMKAAQDLPVSYADLQTGRATKGAAIAMLGKTYLFQKKYAQAQAQFEQLTKAPYTYALNPSYDAQFSADNNDSKESVFDVKHKWSGWATGNQYYMFGGQDGWGGKTTHTGRAQEYGFNDWKNLVVSRAAVASFKYKDNAGRDYLDPRAKLVFYGDAASGGDTDYCNKCAKTIPYDFGQLGYMWRKYQPYEIQEKIDGPQSEINSQIIRYADVLLMLAETQIQQGKMSDALPLINTVRKRVKAFEYTSLGDQTNATNLLIRERQVELCGEQTRYFDLMRWGLFKGQINSEKNQILKEYPSLKANPVADKHLLFPIPNSEKVSNPEVAKDVKDGWN